MNGASPEEEKRIALAAAEWLIKRDRGLNAAEQDEFLQWLAADSRHSDWLARHLGTWDEFNLLAQWRPEHSNEPNPDLLASSRRRWPAWGWVGLGAAASMAIFFALGSSPKTPAGVEPAPGETVAQAYERRVLEDGSVMELNRGAQVAVQFIRRERAVVLVQGEAQFTVAKNPDRPFIVTAGNIKVRAVGTAFNVRVAAQAVEVFVTEGRVRLDSMSVPVAPAMGTEIDSGPTLPELLAGQRTVVSLAPHPPAPQVVLMSPEDIVRQLSWQPQLLDFSSTALGEVVSEFNRRNRLQLIVADPDLNALPIVASFRSDNVDGFVRLLEITADVRAERRGDREIVLHKGR